MKLNKRCLWRLFSPRLCEQCGTPDRVVHKNVERFLKRVTNTAVLYKWMVIEEIILKENPIDKTPFKFLLELNRLGLVRREGSYSEENLTSNFLKSVTRSISNIGVPASFSLVNMSVGAKEAKIKEKDASSKASCRQVAENSHEVIDMPKLDLYTSNMELVETEVSQNHHIIEVKQGEEKRRRGVDFCEYLTVLAGSRTHQICLLYLILAAVLIFCAIFLVVLKIYFN